MKELKREKEEFGTNWLATYFSTFPGKRFKELKLFFLNFQMFNSVETAQKMHQIKSLLFSQ